MKDGMKVSCSVFAESLGKFDELHSMILEKDAEIKRLREAVDLLPAWIVIIKAERARQDAKWGEQNHDDLKWLAILTEEVGELAQSILDDDGENGVKELYQCAAVCVSWGEAIGRRAKEG